MAKRKAFLLRMDPRVFGALQRWSDDELRSLNAQIEYLLRESLRRAGRQADLNGPDPEDAKSAEDASSEEGGEPPDA